MRIQKKTISMMMPFVAAYFATVGIWAYYRQDVQSESMNFFCIAIYVISFFLLKETRAEDKRTAVLATVFALVISLSLVIGKALYQTNSFVNLYCTRKALFLSILAIAGLTMLYSCILLQSLRLLKSCYQTMTGGLGAFTVKKVLLLWIITFLSWIPCFLAYYPGTLAYDSQWQTMQALTGSYTKFHPPLHSFIWSICLKIGMRVGFEPICIYALLQMALLSLSLSIMMVYIISRSGKAYSLISLAYVLLNPVIAIFSLVFAKDAYFGIFFIPFSVLTYELVKNTDQFAKDWKRISSYAITALLACLFRNNMIYVLIVFWLVICFTLRKKTVSLVLISAIALYIGISGPLFTALGVREGNNREMLSVPMQQISLVVRNHRDELDEQTTREIQQYIPYEAIENDFNPRISDPVKKQFNTQNFNSHKKDFFALWGKLFLKYPKEYLEAFMTLNLPYWYAEANAVDAYSKRAYIETGINFYEGYTFERDSKLPGLLDFYQKVARFQIINKLPILSWAFSLGMPICLIFIVGSLLILLKKYKDLLVLLPSFLLWGTYLLGPVSNFRYIFPIFCIYPLLLLLLADNRGLRNGAN